MFAPMSFISGVYSVHTFQGVPPRTAFCTSVFLTQIIIILPCVFSVFPIKSSVLEHKIIVLFIVDQVLDLRKDKYFQSGEKKFFFQNNNRNNEFQWFTDIHLIYHSHSTFFPASTCFHCLVIMPSATYILQSQHGSQRGTEEIFN